MYQKVEGCGHLQVILISGLTEYAHLIIQIHSKAKEAGNWQEDSAENGHWRSFFCGTLWAGGLGTAGLLGRRGDCPHPDLFWQTLLSRVNI